ncbi:GNAT family N-acetyltransferase [Niallia circulans]|uniref:GNAT family N-acetyltransferase n=1 Tax=Niallia circulans TaxID=1397 RepID=A0A553SLZ9_NIACI|nr:GNAT family N-acetyltransferase [Niallia circulans]TRZ38014.1 GNAT family N-acetyltransferase [Niallia circulans]
MEIKVLEKNDANSYKGLRLEALKLSPEAFASSYEEEKDFTLETFANRVSNSSSYTLGAFENGVLAGVVTLQLEQKAKLKHRINIFAMYVAVEKRGKGIAKKLMQEAITKSKQMDEIEAIYLTVGAANLPAKNLYQSLGFEAYGIDKNALKIDNIYFDEELMVLYF